MPLPTPIDLTRLEIDQSDPAFVEIKQRAQAHQRQARDRVTLVARILTAHHTLWEGEEASQTPEFKIPGWLSWTGPIVWSAGSVILSLQANLIIPDEWWWFGLGVALCLVAAIIYGSIIDSIRRDATGLYRQLSAPSFDQRLANQAAITVIALRDDLMKHVGLDDLKAMALGLERRREVRAHLLGASGTVGWLTQLVAVVAAVTATLTLANGLQSATWLAPYGLGTQLGLTAVFLVGIYGVSLAYWSSALSDSQVWLERKLRAVQEAISLLEVQT